MLVRVQVSPPPPMAQQPLTEAKPDRFEILDVLRGIAALGVAAYHMERCWLTGWYHATGPGLYLCVDFFLVLSGFVLSHTYTFAQKPVEPLQFIGHRVARLWPLHAFTVFTMMMASAWDAIAAGRPYRRSVQDTLLELFLLHNVGLDYPHPWIFNGKPVYEFNNCPNWTICNEFWINVAFAFCVGKETPIIVLLALATLGQSLLIMTQSNLDVQHTALFGVRFLNVGMLRCGSAFLLGIVSYRFYCWLLGQLPPAPPRCAAMPNPLTSERSQAEEGSERALLSQQPAGLPQTAEAWPASRILGSCPPAPTQPSGSRPFRGSTDAAATAAGAVAQPPRRRPPPRVRDTLAEAGVCLAAAVLVCVRRRPHSGPDFAAPWLFAAVIVVLARGEGWLSRAVSGLSSLGTVSYSVYLNHFTVLGCIRASGLLDSWKWRSSVPISVLAFWLVLLPYSALTYVLVEQPSLTILRRLADQWLGGECQQQGQVQGQKQREIQPGIANQTDNAVKMPARGLHYLGMGS